MALVDTLETMLARGQDTALLRYSLGGEFLKLEQHDKACEHLRQAVKFDPQFSAAWKLLGKALTGNGLIVEAIKAYEEGIRVAQAKGDKQAAKEMGIFLKRLQK